MKTVRLAGSLVEMPVVGLGTWRAQPEEIERAMWAALDCGYRHFDTAFNYGTEETVGAVLHRWIAEGKGLRRDLFVTTKLPNFGNRATDVSRFLDKSLRKLRTGYVDLYLIHMPFSFQCTQQDTPLLNGEGGFCLDTDNDLVITWEAMEEQVRRGWAKAIGLSNFNADQIRRIYKTARIKPAVLQVEIHAYLQQRELRALCKELGIAVTAYAPLGSPGANSHFNVKYNYSIQDFPDILGHPVVVDLASKYGKSPGQILLRHLVQQDVIVIPKSSNPQRIKGNIDIFDFQISEEDVKKLDELDRGENGRIFDFLFFKGVEKHPEYPFKQRIEGW